MHDIRGICPIIATPFTPSGAVDFDSMRNLIRILAAGGAHGLTLFGIAGEYYKLTEEEERQMIAVTVEECRGAGKPSIISITKHATEVAVRQARYCEDVGTDCLMLLPPFFLKPSAAQIYAHTLEVARSVRVPIMFQYAPEQTGVGIAPEVLARLQEDAPNVNIFKIECRPPGPYISRLLEITGGATRVFAGNAGFQLIEALDRRAAGCMPGCSMFDVYLQVLEKYAAGDRPGAARLHAKLVAVLNHIRQDVEMIIAFEKRILVRRGFIATPYCRKPSYEPDAYTTRLFDELYEGISSHFTAPVAGTRQAGN